MSASGTLMKNTARHDTFSINHPPSTGPIAAVIAVNPDHVPIALPRLSSLNEALMIARLPGTRSAPPAPCTARAIISWLTFGASPHQIDANANNATPMV
jgi:hypothetical protein